MTDKNIKLFAGKRNVRTKFVQLKLKDLHYYAANPRISSMLINYKGKLNDEIIHKLMDEKQPEATRTLFQQIKKDEIINEPIVVYKNQVIEGNTRLWVARELYSRAKTKGEKEKWSLLPCRQIEDTLNEKEINHILCDVHIKKKKDWQPFEQACYLARMKLKEGLTFQQIGAISTFGVSKIKTYIEVYKEMEKHKAEANDWNRYFEAYKDKEVQELHKSGKYDVIQTIKDKTKEGKMGTAQDSRKLKKIVKSERAKKIFFDGNADVKRAFDVAILDNPEEGDPLLKRIKDLEEDLQHIPFDKLQDIKKDKTKIKIIKELTEQVKKLCHLLKIKF
tara:strand:+ start:1096 stop:2097 length:1002 start_codon:yes stop_codon:yes gene_type:complete